MISNVIEALFGALPFLLFQGPDFVLKGMRARAERSPDGIVEVMFFTPKVWPFTVLAPKIVFIMGPNHETLREALDASGDTAQRDFFRQSVESVFNFQACPLRATMFPFRADFDRPPGRACFRKYFTQDGTFLREFTAAYEQEYARRAGMGSAPIYEDFGLIFQKVFGRTFLGIEKWDENINSYAAAVEDVAINCYRPWYIFGRAIAPFPSQRRALAVRAKYLSFSARVLAANRESILRGNNYIYDMLVEWAELAKLPIEKVFDLPEFQSVALYMYGTINNTQLIIAAIPALLAQNPEIVRALRSGQLGYFDKFYAELLRLVMPTPMVTRVYSRARNLAGHYLPGWSLGVISMEAMAQSPSLWVRPDAFEPNRADARPLHEYPFMPFIAGNRICPSVTVFKDLIAAYTQICLKYDFEGPALKLGRPGAAVHFPAEYALSVRAATPTEFGPD